LDPDSEALMRSCIHDMANTLSGIRGILELTDPQAPLSTRDRARLEAILTEGTRTLERSRHLAMGDTPQSLPEPGVDWRRHLEAMLHPLSIIHRCTLHLHFEGDAAWDQWPGDLARGYILALTRQVLPYVQGGSLGLSFAADEDHWKVRWQPLIDLPDSLGHRDGSHTRDIAARWALHAGEILGASLSRAEQALLASIPRP